MGCPRSLRRHGFPIHSRSGKNESRSIRYRRGNRRCRDCCQSTTDQTQVRESHVPGDIAGTIVFPRITKIANIQCEITESSILQTKKRYCGYMYETPDQEKPTYLAKGIETVRRDGCPAVSKVKQSFVYIIYLTSHPSANLINRLSLRRF